MSAAAGIKTTSTSIGTVLTNAQGFTLYWFAIDTPTKSNCNGSCATYWPPVTGKPTAASGVSLPGTWGTIKRSDGSTQATYDGHPLYTYKADSAAGQTSGNGLNVSGGLWWAMTPSGAKPAAAKTQLAQFGRRRRVLTSQPERVGGRSAGVRLRWGSAPVGRARAAGAGSAPVGAGPVRRPGAGDEMSGWGKLPAWRPNREPRAPPLSRAAAS